MGLSVTLAKPHKSDVCVFVPTAGPLIAFLLAIMLLYQSSGVNLGFLRS